MEKRTTRWALLGMSTGLALTLGEVGLSLLSGEPPFWDLWALAALAYATALGLAGGALGLISSRPPGPATFFGFVGGGGLAVRTIPLLQEFLPARPPWAWFALGGVVLGVLGAHLVRTRWRGGEGFVRPPQIILPLLALAVAQVISLGTWSLLRASLVHPPLARLVGALGLPFALLSLSYGAVHASTVGRRLVVLAGLGFATLLSMSSLTILPRHTNAFLRDAPQPRPVGARRDRPNIVLIVLDALRARSLSSYGNPEQTSPALDHFARGAVRYANCIAPATWTLPSHAALFTGVLFPPTAPGATRHAVLPEEVETLAELLAREGYATAGIASNFVGLGGQYNLERGFRYFEGRAAAGYRRLSEDTLRGLAMDRGVGDVVEPLVRGLPPFLHAEEVTARARTWISTRRPSGNPYFLFLNYLDVHSTFRHRWANGSGGLPRRSLDDLLEGRRAPTAKERLLLTAAYDRALEYLDHHVGELLTFLSGQAEAENTWIMVTSDHGEALGEHGRVGHNPDDLHQEILHVPLIMKYPRARPVEIGAVEHRPVQLVDIFPTVLARLGLTGRGSLEGRSLLGPEREATFAMGFGIEAVVEGNLKYVEGTGAPGRLFDLEDDPQETRDVAMERTAEARALQRRLSGWRVSRRQVVPRDAAPSEMELLRSLGYVK